MTINWHDIEWACHFCGEIRPDAMIDVKSVTVVMAVNVPVRFNRRFCRDRLSCVEAANEWAVEAVASGKW